MSDRPSNVPSLATADENQYALYQVRVMSEVSSAMASVMAFVAFQSDESNGGRKPGASTIKRERKNIEQYIGRVNDRSFRRRYRMNKDAFWMLLELIAPRQNLVLGSQGVPRRSRSCGTPWDPRAKFWRNGLSKSDLGRLVGFPAWDDWLQ